MHALAAHVLQLAELFDEVAQNRQKGPPGCLLNLRREPPEVVRSTRRVGSDAIVLLVEGSLRIVTGKLLCLGFRDLLCQSLASDTVRVERLGDRRRDVGRILCRRTLSFANGSLGLPRRFLRDGLKNIRPL